MTKPNRTKSNDARRNVAPVAKPQTEAARVAAVLRASASYRPRKEGEPPVDREVMGAVLVRRLMTMLGHPLRCGDALCRRAGRCVGPTIRCDRDFPPPVMTPAQGDEAIAHFRKMLTADIARRGGM